MNKTFLIVSIIAIISSFFQTEKNSVVTNHNLINKVNAVENQWINYDGTVEQDNNMMKSQFVPYNSNETYKVNNDTYVSYYKGENFIKTDLQDAETELESVEESDGVILSFNKKIRMV